MKNLLHLYTMIFFISFAWEANGQSCTCTDCPVPILDNTVTTSCLDVSGLTNPTLNSGGQGVCGIEMEFNHTWLTEIEILLIAPDGSSIDLVQNDPGGSTPNCTWDIDYVPCSEMATPDPGYPAEFTSTGYNNGAFTGTYYPGDGCFEDLTGSANGTWKLQIEDFVGIDEGEVITWTIIFCDGTGTECGPPLDCAPDVGTYDIETQNICVNGPDYIAAPTVNDAAPAPNYNYTFTISNTSGGSPTDIIDYSDNADFTGYSEGLYLVCGLSYLATDEALLPTPNGVLTNDDIKIDIDNLVYCADIADDCFFVDIQGVVDVPDIMAPDTLCPDEMGQWILLNYNPANFWELDIDGSFSSFSSTSFPTINFAGDGSTDEVEICVTISSACGDESACAVIVIDGGIVMEPEIIGETGTCYGNTYNYTISSLDGIASYNWFIDPLEDSFIIGSSTDPSVVVGLPVDPDQFSASICFEYVDECGNMDEVCLDITPMDLIFENDLTPDSFCGLVGDFNIEVNGTGTGMWVQDSGPGTSFFNDENELNTTVTVSEIGMYSFTFTSDCGNMIIVDIEFLPDPQEPMIDGTFSGCIGETLIFTATNIETSTINNWTISGDGIMVGATNLDMVEVLLDDPASTNVATLCLEIENSCNEIDEVCEDIDLNSEMLINQTSPDFCSMNITLDVLVDGAIGSGQWNLISGPGSITFTDAMSSQTFAAVDALGDYVLEFTSEPCGSTIQVPFTIYTGLLISNLMIECVGEDFIVSFDITGGAEPYTVDGNVVGTSFTSELQTGIGYAFTVDDNSSCVNIVPTGGSNCECETDAGSISPQELLISCDNEDVTVFSNEDDFLDPNDAAIFILFTDLLDPFGSIAIQNTTGIFTFTPPLQYGVIYYVAYVVGDELAGSVDFTDPCLDFATGTSIQFSEPFDLTGIETSEIIGCDIILELTSLQDTDEIGVWSVIDAPSGGTVIFNGVTGISTIATFSEAGTYTILYTIDNGFCSESQQLTVEVTEPEGLSIVNISYICDDANENYQVSFEIEGGTQPYTVEGEILSDNTYTSSDIPSGTFGIFSITDDNDCEPFLFVSEFTCIDNCVSYAEMILTDLIEICADESYTATESGNSIVESDDIGIYILHTNAGNVLGIILDQNATGTFTYTPALSYGVVYYISYVVGNEMAGDIDLTDECLSVAPGQSIVFHDEGIANLGSSFEVCSFEFDLEAEIILGDTAVWTLLYSPMGSTVEYTDSSLLNPSFLVDEVGEYTFIFTVYNGTCINMDTIMVEVIGENFVTVMDDFSTCETSFEIYSITDGSPREWVVLGTTNFTIDNASQDTTTITFGTTGIFEIVRNVGSGICTVSDTLTVEIFEESTFTVLDIDCADDNVTYSIVYELSGNAYPYNVNGQLINVGESIDLSADSGDSLYIYVLDANLCEVFSDTIIQSCECESVIGTMSQDLIEVCLDEPHSIPSSQGTNLSDSDSMVYVLHTSPNATITDILFVSDIGGGFNFDPALMSVNTIYYISLVIFNGDTFDFNVLDDLCTMVNVGTPVLWGSMNTLELPGLQTYCRGETVEFSITYSGVLPFSFWLFDDLGGAHNLEVIQEGESTFTIDIEESANFNLDYYFPLPCFLNLVGELEVEIKELPFVQFDSGISVCNSAATGSTVVLDDLITAGNSEGQWYDPDNNIVSGTIDFDGLIAGDYIYQFVTTGNEPCDEISYSVHILVEDCDCPLDIFLPFDGLCKGEYNIDLDDYLKPEFIDLGSWSILTIEGPSAIQILGSELFIDSINVGVYQCVFLFDMLPPNCPEDYSFEFEIREPLRSGIGPLESIEFCVDDLLEIVLFDYLTEYDAGGEWISQNNLQINVLSGLVDFTLADGGLYTFDYTIPEDDYCPAAVTEVSILINDPLELILSILDPLCFGQNDGSVTLTDSTGIPVSFDLFNSEQEVILNTDSLYAGDYELMAVDENGCVIIESFTLLDPLELFLDLGEDRIIQEGEITSITPVLNFSGDNISLYEWFLNQAQFDHPTFDTLLLSPDGETNVQLIITDEDGCIIADDLLLTVLDRIVDVVLPNVFNPKSSTFGLESFEDISIVNKFSIYDRWGSLIFNKNNFLPADPSNRWDGTYNGSEVINGVYVYSIQYTNQEGAIISIFGDVAVIR